MTYYMCVCIHGAARLSSSARFQRGLSTSSTVSRIEYAHETRVKERNACRDFIYIFPFAKSRAFARIYIELGSFFCNCY